MTSLLIDCRPLPEFELARARCMPPIRCVCMPIETLGERWFELPPVQAMDSWAWLVATSEQRAQLLEAVRLRFGGPCPYKLTILDWVVERERLQAEAAIESGPFTLLPLWRPSPCLSNCIDVVEANLTAQGVPLPWRAVDVGCGSGRDAAFLVSRGCWQVTLVDQSASLLAKARDLCERYNTSSGPAVSAVLGVDITSDVGVSALCAAPCHLLHMARFLHKPLLPQLCACVADGGWLVLMTFADGAQHVGKRTPKHPKHLVYPGELAAVFSAAAGFVAPPHTDGVLCIEDGRPVCDFVCQKAGAMAVDATGVGAVVAAAAGAGSIVAAAAGAGAGAATIIGQAGEGLGEADAGGGAGAGEAEDAIAGALSGTGAASGAAAEAREVVGEGSEPRGRARPRSSSRSGSRSRSPSKSRSRRD